MAGGNLLKATSTKKPWPRPLSKWAGGGGERDGEAQNATTATPTEQDRSSQTQSTHGMDLSASKNETTQRRGRGQCSLPGSEKAPSLNQPP